MMDKPLGRIRFVYGNRFVKYAAITHRCVRKPVQISVLSDYAICSPLGSVCILHEIVAKEAPSTESHAHATQIPEGILKSIKGCGILVPKSAG